MLDNTLLENLFESLKRDQAFTKAVTAYVEGRAQSVAEVLYTERKGFRGVRNMPDEFDYPRAPQWDTIRNEFGDYTDGNELEFLQEIKGLGKPPKDLLKAVEDVYDENQDTPAWRKLFSTGFLRLLTEVLGGERGAAKLFDETLRAELAEYSDQDSLDRDPYAYYGVRRRDFMAKIRRKAYMDMRKAATNYIALVNDLLAAISVLEIQREAVEALIQVAEQRRLDRSDKLQILQMDYQQNRVTGEVLSSREGTYHSRVTFVPRGHHCTCTDWAQSGKRVGPCKHVLALAKFYKANELDTRTNRLEEVLPSLVVRTKIFE